MKRMFLTASFKDVAKMLVEFENGNHIGKKVVFIPAASLVEEVTFFVDEGRAALKDLGLIVNELDLSIADQNEIEEKITGCDYIYVSGGNTFYLLQELKKSGADRMIQNHVKAGKLFIGESAGSIIAAPNIEYSKIMDNPKKAKQLTSYDSLNLVDFYPVPHYSNEPFIEYANKIIKEYGKVLELSPISNSEVILVDGNHVQIRSI